MRELYWIGTDEAGYGPNLGPLCIGGSLFRVDQSCLEDSSFPESEFKKLSFLSQADDWDWHNAWLGNAVENETLPPIDDSKKSYSSGDSLQNLHSVVTSFLLFLDPKSKPDLATAKSLIRLLEPVSQKERRNPVTYWDCFGEENGDLIFGAPSWWEENWFQPQGAFVSTIGEKEFNQSVDEFGNKASVLSIRTLQLAKDLIQKTNQQSDIIVDCDRHGGRKKYLPLLMRVFDTDWMQTIEEVKGRSIYYWESAEGRRVYFRFEVKGERRFPVAVASQFAKYIRERSMECLNRFWSRKVEGIKPTAGYPVDAKRFYQQIEPVLKNSKLSNEEVWRCC